MRFYSLAVRADRLEVLPVIGSPTTS